VTNAYLPRWSVGSALDQVGGSAQGQSRLWALKETYVSRNFANWSCLNGQDFDADYP
jgi:hypothetical protein